jgi:hypothetical protein
LESNVDLKDLVQKRTESDLLQKLRSMAAETAEAKEASEVAGAPQNDLQSLFSSLKVG